MTRSDIAPDLPDLRVVRTASLALHEEADPRRTALLHHRLIVEQVVKNPPVVAPLGADRFVVLDGANRTSALLEIGVPDVVVQVVDYKAVRLTTWFHLVAGITPDALISAIRGVPGLALTSVSLADARAGWEARRTLGYVVLPDGEVAALGGAPDPVAGVGLLRGVVGTYAGRADIYRVQQDAIDALAPYYSELAGLIIFPPFAPADITALAANESKLPTGITRHLIPRRALRLDTQLRFLWSDTTLVEKNRWLAEWTRHKLQASEIRYYQEPTFLFDE